MEFRTPSFSRLALTRWRASIVRLMSTSTVRKKCGTGPIDSTRRLAIVFRIWVSGTSSKPASGRGGSGTAVILRSAASTTSRFTIRPPGPEPAIASSRRPFSSASRRARGEALIRSPGTGGGSSTTVAGTVCPSPSGTGGPPPSGGGGVSGGSVDPSPSAGIRSAISSSAPAITPITVPTAAVPPAPTRIVRRRPSPRATSSIVALSVSISARISPDETSSPSDLSHRTTWPSSIVGDSASM